MKKFIFLQIILAILIHFTTDAKQFVEPQPKCPGLELQSQENHDEDSAVISERQDFNTHFFLTKFVSPISNKSNYKIQILKPPQNLSDSLS
ncbi:MAG: hypothetical protein Q8N83_14685 [Ignavibacteria bacterium]|nr:hypothetical protein [Ignavibacteria bacterium]